jgi:hypothetical protein
VADVAQPKGKGGGKKLMGLPTYVWVGVVAAGLLLGLYLRSKGSSSSTAASPAVDTSSTPASLDSGDPFAGLAGSSVGGTSAADVDTGFSDLLNALSLQSSDTEALTAQLGSLFTPVGQVASSGGAGAGPTKVKAKVEKHKPHKPATKHAKKQHKTEVKKNKKVPA